MFWVIEIKMLIIFVKKKKVDMIRIDYFFQYKCIQFFLDWFEFFYCELFGEFK